MLQTNASAPDLNHRDLCGQSLKLDEFNSWVNCREPLALRPSSDVLRNIAAAVETVDDAIADNQVVYGVTTGFGGMSDNRIDCEQVAALQANLLSFLAAGAGPEIHASHTRGAILLRANVLLNGKSGVRFELIERLIKFFQRDAIPIVREYGSIGASGDLIPLSTIARAITGQSNKDNVRIDGEIYDSHSALSELGLEPIELRAKEGLALVNGTSFSSAIAANATIAAKQGLAISFAVQSILMRALEVDADPFLPFVHECKPHPGQVWSAKTILDLLGDQAALSNGAADKVQDRYSLRCFPQYSGAIVEGIARVQKVVETEMNSVSDNPLIDPRSRTFYQSGNFLGQYLGIAMDDLRRFLGLMAKHLDVQIASLVAPEFNHGLSPSLRGNDEKTANMGLKGLQICGNSIMPMLTYLGNPIVEHFPTHAEQFNQNVNGLSWGAANLAWKSVELFQNYLSVASIFAVQAIDLRAKASFGHFDGRELLGSTNIAFYEAICDLLGVEPGRERPLLFDDSDRWLEKDIDRLSKDISKQGRLALAILPVTESFDQFCEAD